MELKKSSKSDGKSISWTKFFKLLFVYFTWKVAWEPLIIPGAHIPSSTAMCMLCIRMCSSLDGPVWIADTCHTYTSSPDASTIYVSSQESRTAVSYLPHSHHAHRDKNTNDSRLVCINLSLFISSCIHVSFLASYPSPLLLLLTLTRRPASLQLPKKSNKLYTEISVRGLKHKNRIFSFSYILFNFFLFLSNFFFFSK